MRYPLLLLATASCVVDITDPNTVIQPDEFITQAYVYALTCGTQHGYKPKYKLDGIVIHLMSTPMVNVRDKSYNGYTIENHIYIGQNEKTSSWLFSHEFMHAIFRLEGTYEKHPDVFRKCDLD